MSLITSIAGGTRANAATSGGKVTAVNNLGTTGIQVVAANPQRAKLTFHNPGTVDVYVYPQYDLNNVALTPVVGTVGGCFLVFANGGTFSIEGECQFAWFALAASGSNNPLTVMDSNT